MKQKKRKKEASRVQLAVPLFSLILQVLFLVTPWKCYFQRDETHGLI